MWDTGLRASGPITGGAYVKGKAKRLFLALLLLGRVRGCGMRVLRKQPVPQQLQVCHPSYKKPTHTPTRATLRMHGTYRWCRGLLQHCGLHVLDIAVQCGIDAHVAVPELCAERLPVLLNCAVRLRGRLKHHESLRGGGAAGGAGFMQKAGAWQKAQGFQAASGLSTHVQPSLGQHPTPKYWFMAKKHSCVLRRSLVPPRPSRINPEFGLFVDLPTPCCMRPQRSHELPSSTPLHSGGHRCVVAGRPLRRAG